MRTRAATAYGILINRATLGYKLPDMIVLFNYIHADSGSFPNAFHVCFIVEGDDDAEATMGRPGASAGIVRYNIYIYIYSIGRVRIIIFHASPRASAARPKFGSTTVRGGKNYKYIQSAARE